MREPDIQFIGRVIASVRVNLQKTDSSSSGVAFENQVKELLKLIPTKGLSILSSGGFIGDKGFEELTQAITENIKSGYNIDEFTTKASGFTPTPDDIFLEKMRLDRQNKVKPISKANSGVPHKHFEDKRVATTSDFTNPLDKEAGLSTGYQANRISDSHKFMLKHGFRHEKDVISSKQSDDRSDLISEFLMSLLYKRLLFDLAPIIELVNEEGESIEDPKTKVVTFKPKETNTGIYIRSKFFDNFQMLGNFSGHPDKRGFSINNSPQLKLVEGFEKVIAACLILGEIDYHAGNVGIITNQGHYTAVKIDHGKSAAIDYGDERALREDMIKKFRSFEYLDNNTMILSFDAKKLKESIDEMLKISKDEVESLIGNRAHLLQKVGFDLSADSVTKHVTDLTNRISVMREFSRTLDIVGQSNAPEAIKNGGWVTDLGTRDPIEWAVLRGYTINGIDPIAWALSHELNIGRMLYSAAKHGHVHMLTALLASPGIVANITVNNWHTALILAVASEQAGAVEALLASPKIVAALNIKDSEGRTAFMLAALDGQADVVAVMLKSDKIDTTALSMGDNEGRTAFMLAAMLGRHGVISAMLKSDKINGDLANMQDDQGHTALMLAAERNEHKAVFIMLASEKIDAAVQNAQGHTALMLAVIEGYATVVSAMVAGKISAAVLNMKDNQGNTALMLAAEKGDLEVIDNLIKVYKNLAKCRVDPTICNNEGKSALDIAIKNGNSKVIAKLTEYTEVFKASHQATHAEYTVFGEHTKKLTVQSQATITPKQKPQKGSHVEIQSQPVKDHVTLQKTKETPPTERAH